MGWRGRHQRTWIFVDTGYNHDSMFESELLHEEPCEIYGMFGVVRADYTDNWYVIWRPNRNHTQHYDIKVMSDTGHYGHSTAYDSLEDAIDSITYWLANFEPPAKHKKSRPRDSQKTKVYGWEHLMAREIGPKEIADGNIYAKLERKRSHKHLRNFLTNVCKQMNQKVPKLKFRTGGTTSYAGGSFGGIRLLPCHCTELVLIHELTHILHRRVGNRSGGKRHQSHGPEFVGLYMYTLILYAGVDEEKILAHAKENKIKYLLPPDWPPMEKAA